VAVRRGQRGSNRLLSIVLDGYGLPDGPGDGLPRNATLLMTLMAVPASLRGGEVSGWVSKLSKGRNVDILLYLRAIFDELIGICSESSHSGPVDTLLGPVDTLLGRPGERPEPLRKASVVALDDAKVVTGPPKRAVRNPVAHSAVVSTDTRTASAINCCTPSKVPPA
jgi:hypothetical protein